MARVLRVEGYFNPVSEASTTVSSDAVCCFAVYVVPTVSGLTDSYLLPFNTRIARDEGR